MAPKLELCFTMRGCMSKENSADLKAIKDGPSRIIVPITRGFLEGEGLKAELLPGGGDWILILHQIKLDPTTRVSHLDVRTQARTPDDESIFVHYHGVLKIDAASAKVLAWSADAKPTNYGDHEWFSAPIMETSSAQYKWVETALWIGQGHWVTDEQGAAVEYQIYRVMN